MVARTGAARRRDSDCRGDVVDMRVSVRPGSASSEGKISCPTATLMHRFSRTKAVSQTVETGADHEAQEFAGAGVPYGPGRLALHDRARDRRGKMGCSIELRFSCERPNMLLVNPRFAIGCARLQRRFATNERISVLRLVDQIGLASGW